MQGSSSIAPCVVCSFQNMYTVCFINTHSLFWLFFFFLNMRWCAYSRVLDTGENTVLPQNSHKVSVEYQSRSLLYWLKNS